MPTRTRILLVNDDPDALFLLARSVRRALPDAEVAAMRNAPDALKYQAHHQVDLIVTDNTMPAMDGLTFVRQVRTREARLPILMVTHSTHLAREAAAAGVTAYLPNARWNEVGTHVAELLGRPAADR